MGSCGCCFICGKHIKDPFKYDEGTNTIDISGLDDTLICEECQKKMNNYTDNIYERNIKLWEN